LSTTEIRNQPHIAGTDRPFEERYPDAAHAPGKQPSVSATGMVLLRSYEAAREQYAERRFRQPAIRIAYEFAAMATKLRRAPIFE
jgi:hypothetical protein